MRRSGFNDEGEDEYVQFQISHSLLGVSGRVAAQAVAVADAVGVGPA